MAKIYAKTHNMALLDNNQVPVIGTVTSFGQRYLADGTRQRITLVELDYENNGCKDSFYFENGILAYSNFTQIRRKYITHVYEKLAKEDKVKLNDFIKEVVTAYIVKKMGFDD